MSYENFAYYYDSLMDQKFYDDYNNFINTHTTAFKTVLEIGCGTGETAIRLAKNGKKVYATDLSQDMIDVCRLKAMNENVELMLARIDMTDFQINQEVDLVLCLCDSLNYVLNKKAVKQTFKNVFDALKHNGTFIFDVDSLYKMDNLLNNYNEEQDDPDFYFYWHVDNIGPGEVKHHVVIKDKENNDSVDEIHHQKTLKLEIYVEMLKEVGFTKIDYYSDFLEYKEKCERIIFVCRKD
ncbi:MAG: class I SAM-dependent methyltransferase [Thomasclavelia sp.]|nr:class I SAM-dependent methyltransferase [Thomasclavelia sp.]